MMQRITIYMQKQYVKLEECRSALDLFSQTVKKMRNHMGYSLYECPFEYEKSRWNGCLSEGNFFESEMIKVQQGRAVDLKEIEIHGCRKLLK